MYSKLKTGDSGVLVTELQSDLIQIGFGIDDAETSDSVYGTSTMDAVMSFQYAAGLQPTGLVDSMTAGAIKQVMNTGTYGDTSKTLAQTVSSLFSGNMMWVAIGIGALLVFNKLGKPKKSRRRQKSRRSNRKRR